MPFNKHGILFCCKTKYIGIYKLLTMNNLCVLAIMELHKFVRLVVKKFRKQDQ